MIFDADKVIFHVSQKHLPHLGPNPLEVKVSPVRNPNGVGPISSIIMFQLDIGQMLLKYSFQATVLILQIRDLLHTLDSSVLADLKIFLLLANYFFQLIPGLSQLFLFLLRLLLGEDHDLPIIG